MFGDQPAAAAQPASETVEASLAAAAPAAPASLVDKAAPSLVEADVAPAAGSPVAPARGAGVGAARKLRTTDGGPGQRDDDAAAAWERTEGSAVPAVASVRAARVRALNEGLNGNAPALSQEATPAAGGTTGASAISHTSCSACRRPARSTARKS